MPHRQFTILDPAGLHARPAARFVQVASRFASQIVIRYGDRDADAKSLIALLGLTVRPSTQISLVATGSDAEAALNALVAELAPYITVADTDSAAFVPSVAAKPAVNS
jgi:phosphotransferase system HPr (HPr) family protein